MESSRSRDPHLTGAAQRTSHVPSPPARDPYPYATQTVQPTEPYGRPRPHDGPQPWEQPRAEPQQQQWRQPAVTTQRKLTEALPPANSDEDE